MVRTRPWRRLTSASRTSDSISLAEYLLLLSPPSETIKIALRGLVAFFISWSAHLGGVEHGREAAGLHGRQLVLQLFHVSCEFNLHFGRAAEVDEKCFILGVHGFEELLRGEAGDAEFVIHTATRIENEAERQRCVLTGKVRDGLFDAILEDMEVLFVKSENEAVERIGDTGWNEYQGGAGVEAWRVGS